MATFHCKSPFQNKAFQIRSANHTKTCSRSGLAVGTVPQCKEIPVTVPCWQPLGEPACQEQPSLSAVLPYPTRRLPPAFLQHGIKCRLAAATEAAWLMVGTRKSTSYRDLRQPVSGKETEKKTRHETHKALSSFFAK